MNPEIKKAWVQALRGGEYKQAVKELCENADKKIFCCLGVLNDLSNLGHWDNDVYYTQRDVLRAQELCREEYGTNFTEEQLKENTYGEETTAHRDVEVWAELPADDPIVTVTAEQLNKYSLTALTVRLSSLNDAYMTFDELADLIEAQL